MATLLLMYWILTEGDGSNWSLIWEGFVWRLTAAAVWAVVVIIPTTLLAAWKAERPGEFRAWFWRVGGVLFVAGVGLYLVGGLAWRTMSAHLGL